MSLTATSPRWSPARQPRATKVSPHYLPGIITGRKNVSASSAGAHEKLPAKWLGLGGTMPSFCLWAGVIRLLALGILRWCRS